MATLNIIGAINKLWNEVKSGPYALGRVRQIFPGLDRSTFYGIWDRLTGRAAAAAGLARVQNPEYRAGAKSTFYTEFKVPESYRYTYKATLVNWEGDEKVLHFSVYSSDNMTRREAESFGLAHAASLLASDTSNRFTADEGYELANVRWVLHETNSTR